MRRRRTRKISWKKKSRKSRKKRSKRKRVSWFWHSRCLQAKQCQWGWCKMRRMITHRTMLLCWCSVHWCGLALWNTRHKIQRWYFTAPLHDIMKYDTQNTKMVFTASWIYEMTTLLWWCSVQLPKQCCDLHLCLRLISNLQLAKHATATGNPKYETNAQYETNNMALRHSLPLWNDNAVGFMQCPPQAMQCCDLHLGLRLIICHGNLQLATCNAKYKVATSLAQDTKYCWADWLTEDLNDNVRIMRHYGYTT